MNFIVLCLMIVLSSVFYIRSVSPAALEQQIGEIAYEKSASNRKIATAAYYLMFLNYVIYYFYPLTTPLPDFFPWEYWITAVIATAIFIPSMYFMYIGARDAGEETLIPKKEHTLYGGIYEKIRHPQALGEVWLGMVIGLYLNSPLLVALSLVFFPTFYYFCIVEERDLVIRYGQDYIDYRERTGMFIPKRKEHEKQ
ncbi:MAG: methyltransferase family protein [Candidatus Thorarchaeota archaeon]